MPQKDPFDCRKPLVGEQIQLTVLENAPGTSPRPQLQRMMTSSQLSDLFRRLDRDCSGSLDYSEFKNITEKLGLEVSPAVLSDIFQRCDTQKSGSLSLREFSNAYAKVFLSKHSSKLAKGERQYGEFVTATRFGTIGHQSAYFVETFKGTTSSDGTWTKTTSNGQTVMTEAVDDLSLDKLYAMAVADSLLNKSDSPAPRVFWWFDIGLQVVSDIALKQLSTTFGLPESKSIEAVYGDWGNLLNSDPKHRCNVDSGNGSSALTIFCQAMWIKDRPLQYLLPATLDWETQTDDWYTQNVSKPIKDYYGSRIAWMFSGGYRERDQELLAAFESADSIARRVSGDDDGFDAVAVPLTYSSLRASEPTWLTATAQLRRTPPRVQYATLGLHLLLPDKASIPGVLLTIRQLESDKPSAAGAKEASFNKIGDSVTALAAMDLASRSGILGRILAGARICVNNVIAKKQAIDSSALADHLSELATLIVGMVHNFSMNTSGALDEWLSVLEEDANELAVSKHTEHCRMAKATLRTIDDYVTPIRSLCVTLIDQCIAAGSEAVAADDSGTRNRLYAVALKVRPSVFNFDICWNDKSSPNHS